MLEEAVPQEFERIAERGGILGTVRDVISSSIFFGDHDGALQNNRPQSQVHFCRLRCPTHAR